MLGLLVDANSCLHLYVNGMDQGAAAQDIPSPCYPFIDLYGQCEQVSGGPSTSRSNAKGGTDALALSGFEKDHFANSSKKLLGLLPSDWLAAHC